MNIVDRAKKLAYLAHAWQADKAGQPYIDHVARVAAAVTDDPEAESVAWLHDVLEDRPDFEKRIWTMGFSDMIMSSIIAITRIPEQSAEKYYSCIRLHPLALRVKLADISDNADESRLALLNAKTADRLRRKYANARKALGAA